MKMLHRIAQARMPLLAGDDSPGALRDHVRTCISCQAEAARYRTMGRVLATFSHERYEPPFDLVPGVLAGLESGVSAAMERPVAEAKRLAKAGTAAAVAGAVAGVVVIARLARRRAA